MAKNKKVVTKKRAVKKKVKLPSKDTIKINFLKQKKDINDKFNDLVSRYVQHVFYNTEEMEIRGLKFNTFKEYRGLATLSKKLGMSPATIKKAIKTGYIKPSKKINMEYNKLKKEKKRFKQEFSDFKKTTKQFTVHNFTHKNFFTKPKIRLNKYDQYHFRAGLEVYFERVKYTSTGIDVNENEPRNMEYHIDNFSVSSASKDFSRGYEKIYEDIKFSLLEKPSLKFFRFNYFDVIIVTMKSPKKEVKKK